MAKISRRQYSNLVIICAFAAIVLVFGGFIYKIRGHGSSGGSGTNTLHTEEISVIAAPANAPKLQVLFVGNSYIFVNDLPGVIANIAATDSANPVNLRAGRFVAPAAPLIERWRDHFATDPFSAGRWDYVVLQESPIYDVTPEYIPLSVDAVQKWDQAIRQNGARTLIFGPWARKQGSPDYKMKDLRRFKTPDAMQMEIDRVRKGIAARVGATYIPIGDYWMACRAMPGAPELYFSDATHPSPAGTYLTALLFYRQMTGHGLQHVTYVPPNLSQKDAAFILRCALY